MTDLFSNGEQDVNIATLEQRAVDYIAEFEDSVGRDVTDKLWTLVDDSRMRTLDELVKSGLLDKNVAEEWLSRFDHYVPLQGFAEEVIGEERNANFNSTIQGRVSEAKDPLATLVNMEYVAVTNGMRNRVKQALYSLAMNHKTDLLTVMPISSVKNPVTGEWEEAVPKIDDSMSLSEKQQILDDFIKQHREKISEEKDLPDSDKIVKGSNKVDVGKKVLRQVLALSIVCIDIIYKCRHNNNGRYFTYSMNH